MGGIAVFKWEIDEFTLLHNRENWNARVITEAAWDPDENYLGGWCGVNNGSWCAVSKRGRVAFLVDSTLHEDGYGVTDVPEFNASNLTTTFLDDVFFSTPNEFIDFVAHRLNPDGEPIGEFLNEGPRDVTYRYSLIIADLSSRKMYHLSKPVASERAVKVQEVPFGVHTLSLDGLDHTTAPKDLRLRSLFDHNVGSFDGKTMSFLEKLAKKVMMDREPTVDQDPLSAIYVEKMACHGVSVQVSKDISNDPRLLNQLLFFFPCQLGIQRYGTSSTTAFSVRPVTEVTTSATSPKIEALFYEISPQGERKITFDIQS
ncbi:unnamed protein product [Arabis nemorensis]|uniref:Uncharacterized protein n=1 Tax=Arabis nemorensis TaxID=586526 RepID=A0A565AWU7_9BRAS|nr:unnamed protein product [Arabis nemorensis]